MLRRQHTEHPVPGTGRYNQAKENPLPQLLLSNNPMFGRILLQRERAHGSSVRDKVPRLVHNNSTCCAGSRASTEKGRRWGNCFVFCYSCCFRTGALFKTHHHAPSVVDHIANIIPNRS